MTPDSDAIEAVKRGEKDRYAELVSRYQRMVYGIAWSQLGDSDLCDEAAQETFIRGYRYLVALRRPEKFAGWLARIARNVSASLLRRHHRELISRERWRLEMPEVAPSPASTADDLSPAGTLPQLLAELTAAHRECLVLFYMEGKNIREAAAALSISETAFKTRLHRARTELRGRLEEQLETSLAGMAPRKDFSGMVLPLLPAMPLAAGLGASTVTAKAFSGFGLLGSLAMLLIVSLAQGLLLTATLRWYAKLEADNLVEGAGRELRGKMIRRTMMIMGSVAFVALFVSQGVAIFFGPLFFFQASVPFLLWGLWRTGRMLRFNRSPFVWGQIFSLANFLITFVLVGFCGAPFWIFFAGVLLLNIVLYQTNKSKPFRHDYNLFLRQTSGLLGKAVPASGDPLHCTGEHFKAFARFLGDRFLINDYKLNQDGVHLRLPPVSAGARNFFCLPDSSSSVRIAADGTARAQLGARDIRHLRKLKKVTLQEGAVLEEQVAGVMSTAFRAFMDGDSAQAEALLQPQGEAAIFKSPVAASRAHRVIGRVSIAAAIIALVTFALLGQVPTSFSYPKPVSQSAAAAALLSWSGERPPAPSFQTVIGAAEQPSLAFLEGADPASYRSAVFEFLREQSHGAPLESLLKYSTIAPPLYHALRNNTLSPEQFAALGFTAANVRSLLGKMDTTGFADIARQGTMSTIGSFGSYTTPDLEFMAYRLACLKELGCLELIDARALPAEIAAHQVTPAWKLPAGYAHIDTTKAAGLFDFGWCNLRNIRAALWILQLLGRLDAIDREACIQGLLRFHQGRGVFRADHRTDPCIALYGQEDDMYYALESLYMLGALDRIADLDRWQYRPETSTLERNGKKEYGVVTGQAIVAWARQLRLEELRRK